MGKRSRQRTIKPQVIKLNENKLKDLLSNELLSQNPESEQAQNLKQIIECINEIYSEHINDLELRKKKRLEWKIPTEYFQPYNLVVNWSFQQRMILQIESLINFQLGGILKESLLSTVDIFIDYLHKFVTEFKGKKSLLQIIIVYETYHTLLNSISQVGSIISLLISKNAFEVVNKTKFYEKIGADYMNTLDIVIKKESTGYMEDFLNMKSELKTFFNKETKSLCYDLSPTLCSESCSDEDSSEEAMHNLPIDDLVKILSEPNKKRKKKKNKKSFEKQNSTASDVETNEIDTEIEEFQKRLESEKPFSIRKKLVFSDKFLASLRKEIESLRKKLRHNN